MSNRINPLDGVSAAQFVKMAIAAEWKAETVMSQTGANQEEVIDKYRAARAKRVNEIVTQKAKSVGVKPQIFVNGSDGKAYRKMVAKAVSQQFPKFVDISTGQRGRKSGESLEGLITIKIG